MINATAEYALRTVVFLASSGPGTIGREEIAAATQVPTNYLVKVMKTLDQAGIIQSQRGPGGGYRLIRDAEELTVYEVVAAVSALPRIEACPLGIAEHINLCPLHARLDAVAALTEAAFRQTRIAEMVPRKENQPQKDNQAKCTFPTPKR